MTFRDVGGSYYCTGFFINNIQDKAEPWFMTANHCISYTYPASTLVTYLNYEDSDCGTDDASLAQTLSGSTLISTSLYTDFTLLVLNEMPPPSYRVYMAGWDASGTVPESGACIHHPMGKPKCIAI